MTITLREARNRIVALEPVFQEHGLHTALTGGTLYRGSSEKDIDVVVFPHNSTADNVAGWAAVCDVLCANGWSRSRTTEQMHTYWQTKGLTDRKRVEVWRSPDLVRFDFILMGFA